MMSERTFRLGNRTILGNAAIGVTGAANNPSLLADGQPGDRRILTRHASERVLRWSSVERRSAGIPDSTRCFRRTARRAMPAAGRPNPAATIPVCSPLKVGTRRNQRIVRRRLGSVHSGDDQRWQPGGSGIAVGSQSVWHLEALGTINGGEVLGEF